MGIGSGKSNRTNRSVHSYSNKKEEEIGDESVNNNNSNSNSVVIEESKTNLLSSLGREITIENLNMSS